MEHEKESSSAPESSESDSSTSGWGGARPGAGRKPGRTDRLTARALLAECERVTGRPFAETLVEGYHETILNGDWRNRVVYEKMILDKVSTTMIEAEVTDPNDTVEQRREAFRQALAAFAARPQQDK
jgi:hypothetical protein